MVEATAITPEGRITPEDCGLWKDSQMEPLKQIVEFAHSQGQKIGLQIAHAGRKASTVAPWLNAGAVATEQVSLFNAYDCRSRPNATEKVRGWPNNVYGPSTIPYNEKHAKPKEMTTGDIENFKKAWLACVKRAVECGFDVIEIHNAQ